METNNSTDNTDLFQFEFTDREKEQAILQNFLCNHQSKALWIYGKSGTGKSFFVDNCITQSGVIYVENKNNTEAGNCILDLIHKLQEFGQNSFWKYVRNLFPTLKSVAQDFPALKTMSESNFFQYMFSKNTYIVDEKNQYNNLASILQKYVDDVLGEASLVFIIDNFDKCDENSVEILLDFVKTNIDNPNRKFIFISTEQEGELSRNEKKLEREIPCQNLEITAIPNETYFINMLPTAFDISNLRKEDTKRIYDVCHGLPEKLQHLLMNLNRANAIEYFDKKISFNLSVMENYILSGTVANLEIENFSPIECCLMLVVVCLGIPLRVDLLIILAQQLYDKMYLSPIAPPNIHEALHKLTPKPLTYNFNEKNCEIYTDHDLTFGAALKFFKDKNMYLIACDAIYCYLHETPPREFLSSFSESGKNELLANLSYEAQCSNWTLLNLQCGNYFYKLGNYIRATKYFNRFLTCMETVPEQDKLNFLIANYEVGLYKNADTILSILAEQSAVKDYVYYIYAGKTLNMNDKSEQAEECFLKAIELAEKNSSEQLYAKYMLHLILTQMPGRWKEAEDIYKSLVRYIMEAFNEHNDEVIYQPCNAKILKCCYNFFFNDEALDLMMKAEKIAEHLHMKIEKAFILNNMGFEYIRQNNNQEAMDCFKQAHEILIKTKQHEAAYALNNIGICQMFEQDYSGAILSFKNALLYQKSYYLQLTANTMLMQCYFLTKNTKHRILADELGEYVFQNENRDPAIVRKICMNLAIYWMGNDMEMKAKYYLEKVIHSVSSTSSEYRALELERKLYKKDNININKEYVFAPSKYFTESLFDPWFITLSHD